MSFFRKRLLMTPLDVPGFPLEIDGDPPALAGQRCDALLVQQYWHKGELYEPANVIYMQFAGNWHRLFFDRGIIFWRTCESRPERNADIQDEFSYPLIDLGTQLGLTGVMLERCEAESIQRGSQVRMTFSNGVRVVFEDVDDTTLYRAAWKA
jgi:hypothetical protein